MNTLNDITDKEFIPFLHSLGVETYNKSFEWMLQDPDFGGALKWLYRNLDHNNALTAREEYRYKELEKKKCLLPIDELDTAIASLQEEFKGLCLPGDQDALEDMKLDISMHNDRLDMLMKHEEIVNDLIKQNHLIKDELDIELTKLSAKQHQYEDDEKSLGEQCIALAEEVDNIVDDVCDVIANNLKMASTNDEEMTSKFFAFGPFDAYKQCQSLYMSHFDLYVSIRLTNKHPDRTSDQDLQRILNEAANMEERLSDALCTYISTKAELCGEQAKLALVNNYTVHPNRVSGCLLEVQSALEILQQEENILDQQLQDAILKFVSSRTNLAVETAARSALSIRKQVHSDLEFLLECSQQALCVDKLVYSALRAELCSVEELLHFASQMRLYLVNDSEAISSRIESMNEICSQQLLKQQRLQSNILQQTLSTLLHTDSNDLVQLVRAHNDLRHNIQVLNEQVIEDFRNKEIAITVYSASNLPIREYLHDGSSRKVRRRSSAAAQLLHHLMELMAVVDDKVLSASGRFATVKKEDKYNLRKFWQWFLMDQAKLLSTLRAAQPRGHLS
ncbi:augmin complex subunit dgt3 [Papilio machaon]|uniref:augmin complex subunit dgt3 n=1 Tax=Papilio machaon TaxID=76193 RepID=UPI001E665AF9|nr:augmin complex subunit dgt3 [Papilio machaon]